MELLSDLIYSFDPSNPHFRPTELYNENWLLKLALHQASKMNDASFPLGFKPSSTWFSESLLPTAFKARYQGDQLSESRTNADGVIGHFSIGTKGKADLDLHPDALQFTVVEAKIGSPLSPGIKNDRNYDQAARTVACMAEVIALSKIDPAKLERLDFIVLAPRYSIENGIFANEMEPSSIRSKVRKRVAAYGGEHDDWFVDRFEPILERIQLCVLSWEDTIKWIGRTKPTVASDLFEFYELCLDYK